MHNMRICSIRTILENIKENDNPLRIAKTIKGQINNSISTDSQLILFTALQQDSVFNQLILNRLYLIFN